MSMPDDIALWDDRTKSYVWNNKYISGLHYVGNGDRDDHAIDRMLDDGCPHSLDFDIDECPVDNYNYCI